MYVARHVIFNATHFPFKNLAITAASASPMPPSTVPSSLQLHNYVPLTWLASPVEESPFSTPTPNSSLSIPPPVPQPTIPCPTPTLPVSPTASSPPPTCVNPMTTHSQARIHKPKMHTDVMVRYPQPLALHVPLTPLTESSPASLQPLNIVFGEMP